MPWQAAQNQDVKQMLLPLVLVSLVTPAVADRVDDLEQRIAELERQVAALKAPTRPVRPTIDPGKRYSVPLDDSPALGPVLAPITIVAGLQFPEPYTHRVWPTLMQLLAENNDVRLVIKSFVVHPQHAQSSNGACAIAYQGKIAEAEDLIWTTSQEPDPKTGTKPWGTGLTSISRGLPKKPRQINDHLLM